MSTQSTRSTGSLSGWKLRLGPQISVGLSPPERLMLWKRRSDSKSRVADFDLTHSTFDWFVRTFPILCRLLILLIVSLPALSYLSISSWTLARTRLDFQLLLISLALLPSGIKARSLSQCHVGGLWNRETTLTRLIMAVDKI